MCCFPFFFFFSPRRSPPPKKKPGRDGQVGLCSVRSGPIGFNGAQKGLVLLSLSVPLSLSLSLSLSLCLSPQQGAEKDAGTVSEELPYISSLPRSSAKRSPSLGPTSCLKVTHSSRTFRKQIRLRFPVDFLKILRLDGLPISLLPALWQIGGHAEAGVDPAPPWAFCSYLAILLIRQGQNPFFHPAWQSSESSSDWPCFMPSFDDVVSCTAAATSA